MSHDDGGPAFPTDHSTDVSFTDIKGGMSLRDWFAGQALAGMHARAAYDPGQATPQQRASLCYIDADAMLAERKKGGA